jgi:hypothetical protein
MSAMPYPEWCVADRLIRAAGVPYDTVTRQAQHQLVRLVAAKCAALGNAVDILTTFGEPDPDPLET